MTRHATPPPGELTDRQRDIYEFIKSEIVLHGRPPTVREIMAAFDIKSPNGAQTHVRALEKKGMVRLTSGSRGIELVHDPRKLTRAKVEEAAASLFITDGGREGNVLHLSERRPDGDGDRIIGRLGLADVVEILCRELGVES